MAAVSGQVRRVNADDEWVWLPALRFPSDVRVFQIVFLGALLAAGAWFRDFSISRLQIALTFATAISLQAALSRLTHRPKANLQSAAITALGLSLLLRSSYAWAHPAAAAIAIGAKFLIRIRGKHIFNPANLGVVTALLIFPGCWVSPGQWGHEAILAGWLTVLGVLVISKTGRGDISWWFLAAYLGMLAARIVWLGQRWAVFGHQLGNGSLLLFAFFMISDPRTIPDHWRGRMLHAALVAALAYQWQFTMFRTNGLLLALVVAAPLVPLWDQIWTAEKFEWSKPEEKIMTRKKHGTKISLALLTLLASLLTPAAGHAFCGFYVGKADIKLYNQASQVVMVRHDDKTVISMMNDYQGELKDFALVVPVPEILKQGQVHIGDRELFKHLDEYSAPRLVEYNDENPCQIFSRRSMNMPMAAAEFAAGSSRTSLERAKALGVKVEAQYAVGEYQIVILSAKESDGLAAWLVENGYQMPQRTAEALQPYIKQKMKFFVARVDLDAQAKSGLSYLRPLQFAFESPKFMLPIRLGMINAKGPQDLVVYALSAEGRVEATNYRTLQLPTGVELPGYVRSEFAEFYKAMFTNQLKRNDEQAVFTQYMWNMSGCDPCSAPPLSPQELRQLGVFWLPRNGEQNGAPMPMEYMAPTPVFLTRLHVRYSAATFPEDLSFQETRDQEPFQLRYVIHNEWKGSAEACPQAKTYFEQLRARHTKQAETLASLTGWDLQQIVRKAGIEAYRPQAWWQQIWSE